ncbi:hypothetical protein JZ751_013145 [Albula glossodonta]|uniref:Uncharacterized protein n=1 Tax=Albula glossodonta TaxID=121402 RepID=A0A8T2NUD7_9TELE|nr:hypothetical protein JZ751_013145 [Albula glossodonta]
MGQTVAESGDSFQVYPTVSANCDSSCYELMFREASCGRPVLLLRMRSPGYVSFLGMKQLKQNLAGLETAAQSDIDRARDSTFIHLVFSITGIS